MKILNLLFSPFVIMAVEIFDSAAPLEYEKVVA
jgi:hypothetical protein